MKHENQPGENKVTLILLTFLTNNKREKKNVRVSPQRYLKRARNNLRNSHAKVTRLLSLFVCFYFKRIKVWKSTTDDDE